MAHYYQKKLKLDEQPKQYMRQVFELFFHIIGIPMLCVAGGSGRLVINKVYCQVPKNVLHFEGLALAMKCKAVCESKVDKDSQNLKTITPEEGHTYSKSMMQQIINTKHPFSTLTYNQLQVPNVGSKKVHWYQSKGEKDRDYEEIHKAVQRWQHDHHKVIIQIFIYMNNVFF